VSARYYVLDGTEPRAVDAQEWARWFQRCERHVALSEFLGVRVSTVFLGLNHQWGDGPPLIFETMIFGGPHDQYQERCSTWDEAERMHRAALRLARWGWLSYWWLRVAKRFKGEQL
jgi:hypothetical protein